MNEELRTRTRAALDQLRSELLDQRTADGHWVGQLSSSALSTATAVSAIAALVVHGDVAVPDSDREMISRGVNYLRACQNDDGGFGDTDRSLSNIATSYLVLAASALADQAVGQRLGDDSLASLDAYIQRSGGIAGLRQRYGTDKTFVVPIMTNMAIAGLIDWDQVAALPFEAAVFPQSMYRLLRMPVVSYAIPALVAIGQARHFHGKRTFAPWRWVRSRAIGRTMDVLRRMQPQSGGYLEATPLTSFVVMSLAVTQRGDHAVCRDGLRFLRESMLDDGSWPIDTNLATWVTSLTIDALASDPDDDGAWCSRELVQWHLSCQHLVRHPFTGAEPGGWGWTDLSGAVPDSDDTPGAILALERMRGWIESGTGPEPPSAAGQQDLVREIDRAIVRGQRWLIKLQNRNGGWPTFCRGWGKLPFDRSSTDLTAHAMRALTVSCGSSQDIAGAADGAIRRGRAFLQRSQRPDGAWLPLWFGNQDRPDEDNPVYGTSKVLAASRRVSLSDGGVDMALQYLIDSQNDDGGWGGGPSITRYWAGSGDHLVSSVEETALAVDAIVSAGGGNDRADQAIIAGVRFLLDSIESGRHRVPWPIGFYFAKLWYHERLYPLIFTAAALGKALQSK
ncbi:Squalene--hopene cyclase [Rubripirellula lacrimiformis]|uniref:Squalene--hopene cyclase n=1 Tax=Rubripirellula lacrimiformis TaxID=1930273 RepID=A0A517N9U4_9BACT|nr:prenyltransferase/squalene oxidase repeat-containing protein [Rubripirellula lacrimiformis]QDT03906.1 Squalene--hopene cyclase [Rubripirellula lacrimiformis]